MRYRGQNFLAVWSSVPVRRPWLKPVGVTTASFFSITKTALPDLVLSIRPGSARQSPNQPVYRAIDWVLVCGNRSLRTREPDSARLRSSSIDAKYRVVSSLQHWRGELFPGEERSIVAGPAQARLDQADQPDW